MTKTADTIELQGNVRICVLPCRPAAIRGLRCILVVLDELAHYRSSENLPLDKEAWRAALPTLLMTGGELLALSSPSSYSGLLYDLHKAHYGNDASDVLVWQSPSTVLNPSLTAAALNQIRTVDPEGAAAEIDGEFLRSVSALLDEETLTAAVDVGVAVRPPVPGVKYRAHVDVATGMRAGANRWAAAVGHRDRAADGVVVDALLLIRPPFSVTAAAERTAALCRAYGVSILRGDRFAAGFSDEAFTRAGLELRPAELTTSDAHLSLAAAIGSGRVRLLDHPELLKELRGLERRRGGSKDRVSHRVGAHDDLAAVVSGLVARTPKPTRIGAGFMHIDGL